MKLQLLDLFCGAGGAARGFYRAGFQVTGVDIRFQPSYPYPFIEGDVIEILERGIEGFDVVHASPPCQRWSRITRERHEYPDYITPLRPLLKKLKIPYVIENVPGAPLRNPIKLCGSSFGLGVLRHRLFESNVDLYPLPCIHGWQKPRYVIYGHGKQFLGRTVPVYGTPGHWKGTQHWAEAMGIYWMNRYEITEAIPPAYTHFIGAQLRAHIESERIIAELDETRHR